VSRPAHAAMPIIVGGFYRSGTTLLRRLLDAHSRIHCGPEVKFFKDFYGDYLQDELHHVRLFSTLSTLGLSENEMLSIFGRAFVEGHRLAARKVGKVRWADKNPENVLYLNQWGQLLPDGFLFVHVVRSPLDALASLKEVGFEKAVPPHFEDKVRLYRKFCEAGIEHSEAFPETSLTLRYEELVHEPTACLSRLFLALGESFEAAILERFADPERGDGIEDPKVKLTRKVHTDSVGRWRKDLSQEEIRLVRDILPPLLLEETFFKGYSKPGLI